MLLNPRPYVMDSRQINITLLITTVFPNSSTFPLQTICRVIFNQMYPLQKNLFYNPPTSIAVKINELLQECLIPGQSQVQWTLLAELKSLLLSSTMSMSP